MISSSLLYGPTSLPVAGPGGWNRGLASDGLWFLPTAVSKGAIAATTAWLKQANISAAVIGGLAASLLGRPRVTKDVGLVPLADDDDVPRLLSLGRGHGFEPRVADAIALLKFRVSSC